MQSKLHIRKVLGQITPLRYTVHRVQYYSRQRALSQARGRSPLLVVLGASGKFQKGWIPTEINQLNILKESDWQRHFEPNSIDALLAEHVWEHLTPEQGKIGAKHCFYYLKPGGYLRIAVPDGNHPDSDYIEHIKPGGTGPGADDHKLVYTFDSLSALFQSEGFEVHLLEYFDNTGKFHFESWNPENGLIRRSSRYDNRNMEGKLNYTSIMLDVFKPRNP